MAGARLLDELVRLGASWTITVVGDEPCPPYDRLALGQVLAGGGRGPDLVPHDLAWHERRGIELHTGCVVEGIDPGRRRLRTAHGEMAFDACVLATGSLPLVPVLPGIDLEGVLLFHTLDDVSRILRRGRRDGRAVVIGDGSLGRSAASGLERLGMRVVVVPLAACGHPRENPTGTAVARIGGRHAVDGVILCDGRSLPADLVVVCAGSRPRTGLAAAAELDVGRGIRVDSRLTTSAPGIYAVGECAEYRGTVWPHMAALAEQVRVLARRLAGDMGAFLDPEGTPGRSLIRAPQTS